jgi:hypothetical protein
MSRVRDSLPKIFGRRIQISERTPAGDGWIWLVRLASKLLKRSFGVS